MEREYWICTACHNKKISPLGTYCPHCGGTFERFVKADELEKSCEDATESLAKECHRLDVKIKELEAEKTEAIELLEEVFPRIEHSGWIGKIEIVKKMRDYLLRQQHTVQGD